MFIFLLLNFKAQKLSRFKSHNWTLTTCEIQMFQCYMQPAQEKAPCPHSCSPLCGAHRTPCLPSAPWAGAPACPESSLEKEPAQPWASPAQTAPACCRCSCPEGFHFLTGGSAGSLELTQYGIRNWHFLLGTMGVSWNCLLQPSQSLAARAEEPAETDTSWSRTLRCSWAGAGWGRLGLFPKEHCTNTA